VFFRSTGEIEDETRIREFFANPSLPDCSNGHPMRGAIQRNLPIADDEK
jgi:hypothetical protein